MKKEYLILASRCFLFALATLGVVLEITKYGWHMLMYYTVLSNLLVAGFAGWLVYLMVSGKDWRSDKVLRMKAGVTMSIMITFVIYHFMLSGLASDFWRLENLLCHYIVPLYFFADTVLVDDAHRYKKIDPLIWTVLPVLYMIYALLNGLVFKVPISDAVDSPFPYFFLNVPKYGLSLIHI